MIVDNLLMMYVWHDSKKYKPEDLIVRATADNILPDGNLVKLLNNEIKRRKLNYLSINKKIHLLPKGFSLEIFKVKELLRILSELNLERILSIVD